MQRSLVAWSLSSLLLASVALAQRVDLKRDGLPTQSARIVRYQMEVRLDPAAKTLHGKQKISFRNATKGSTNELQFHLYLNAFESIRTTHLREERPFARKRYANADEFGHTGFDALRLVPKEGEPVDLLKGLRYIVPDDGNKEDRTVALVPLPSSLAPGDTIQLETEFTAKLPKCYRRTGWGPGNFFMAAQWFPKLGVLEDGEKGKSAWNCHQFHAWTEFYADYGSFDVMILVPADYVVGATGELMEKRVLADGYAFWHYVQNDVHDFAWVADPDYRVHEFTFRGATQLDPRIAEIARKRLGRTDAELALSDVKVRLLLHPEHDTELQVARHRRAVEVALAFYGSRFGRYPYKTLTVVDPGRDEQGRSMAAGMEYPTMINCGAPILPHPRRLSPEGVTVHEFGHQFWYGLSGNNEFEESWLDEGICSFTEARAQDLAYHKRDANGVGDPVYVSSFGPFYLKGRAPGRFRGFSSGKIQEVSRLQRLPLPELLPEAVAPFVDRFRIRGTLLPDLPVVKLLQEIPTLSYERDLPYRYIYADRLTYLTSPNADPVVTPAWLYLDRPSYRSNSYQRPATILCTLERMMGFDKFWAMLRSFHEKARFAHPTTSDFLALVREFGGDETAEIAREFFYGTMMLDYGVLPPKMRGEELVATVRRYRSQRVPVELRFSFSKGKVLTKRWERKGQARWKSFVFTAKELAEFGDLVEFQVDPPKRSFEPAVTGKGSRGPAGVYLLDENLLNNSWRKDRDARPARRIALRMLLYLQNVLSFFGGIG